MRPVFHPHLVNGPLGDPALYVECMHKKRALLFDAGDLHGLAPRKLLKVTHVFITHAHMDHFIGFDHLVRIMLGRPKALSVCGPAPLLEKVISKLRGYSWNLVEGYAESLSVEITQLGENGTERVRLDCRDGFREPDTRAKEEFGGLICREYDFQVHATLLDHKIPSMAFCLEEPRHVQVMRSMVEELGLKVGSWVTPFKEAVLRGEPDHYLVSVAPAHKGPLPLGWLKGKIARIIPGQRLGYVGDTGYGEENRRRIISLVRGADLLFIEAAFVHEDRERAEETAHLTAFQAGRLAAEAAVGRVIPFHFSPKYFPDEARVESEVQEAFRGFTSRN